MATTVGYRTCPFCEATCGLAVELDGDTVVSVRGDKDDVFSRGFICPKATGLKSLQEDPDRLRTPLVKREGEFVEATWDQAFAEIDARLTPLLEQHGRDACAVYLGNPSAHSLGALMAGRVWLRALASKNVYSASTVDQMPKQVSAGLMFGYLLSVPVPDVDRTDHLLILGANPLASNGSLLTAPDMRGRLRRIRERGGKVVVVDPRRTRTAEVADEHHFIRPGADAALLFAMVAVVFADGLVDIPESLAQHLNGVEDVERLAAPFTPEAVAPFCGIAPDEIRRMTHELAAADSAAVYGRIGTCTQEFGTTASWLVDVLNALTGNLDRPGGAMWTRAAAGSRNTSGEPGRGRGVRLGRWTSRVRGLPEMFGELPVACLAEEIETPGDGQVRALVTLAGNPALSTPNAGRLQRVLPQLDFMLAIDIYVNETTRHADVILPAPPPLQKSHYDVALYQLAARNVANYSPPLIRNGIPDEWTTLLRLTGVLTGQGPNADVDAIESFVVQTVLQGEVGDQHSPLYAQDAAELMSVVGARRGTERMLDVMLRAGPYGLTLDELEANPHGVDLGALEPRLPDVLRTPSGKVELAPPEIVADVPRLEAALGRHQNGGLVLVGRRQLRSNNSWMHNLPQLVGGTNTCTLQISPTDADRLGLTDGETAKVSSRAGEVAATVEVTDAVMEGVVSLPHGWGHGQPGTRMGVAAQNAGVNSNLLADELEVDPLSGNAVLNGIPVEVAPG